MMFRVTSSDVLIVFQKILFQLSQNLQIDQFSKEKRWEMLPRVSCTVAETLQEVVCADGRGPVMGLQYLLLHPQPRMPFWETGQSE